MYKKVDILFRSSIVILLIALLIGCSRSPDVPIRLGVNVWPGYEYLFLAQELGYYEMEGVNIQLVETGSLDDLRSAFERGKIDGMASSVIEVVQAAANTGRVATIFMIPDYSNGADVIISNESVKDVGELRGKKVGLEVGSLGEFMVARALQDYDMSLQDIVVVPMSQEQMLQAMDEKQVDAVMTYPPVSVELAKNPKNSILFTSADIPGEVMDVVTLSREVIKKNPELPKKIINVWQRALTYAKENPERAHKISADREGITPEEFASALEGVKLLSFQEQKLLFENNSTIRNVLNLVKNVIIVEDQRKNIPKEEEFIFDGAFN